MSRYSYFCLIDFYLKSLQCSCEPVVTLKFTHLIPVMQWNAIYEYTVSKEFWLLSSNLTQPLHTIFIQVSKPLVTLIFTLNICNLFTLVMVLMKISFMHTVDLSGQHFNSSYYLVNIYSFCNPHIYSLSNSLVTLIFSLELQNLI